MYRTQTLKRRTGAVIALSLGMLAVVACGDDDDAVAGGVGDSPTTTTEVDDGGGEPLLVTAKDYGFEGLPTSVEVGTELALTNVSEEEVHEIVLLKVDDAETRPLNELLALPEAERDAIAVFRGVTVAFPGEDAGFTDGSMTLSEPGRYVLICTIPTGADPQAYRDAVADPEAEGPPQVDGGPPHLVNGMVAEIEVAS
ncbi:hypothetical protein [Actinospongicola halichondriae]|uniref:hypothetical protein n=1 Tax=Actinospongicola halichondriae TaxID=3236844 RepID=UPI003D5345EE